MKILFFYQYFGTHRGSWSTRVYELTRRWVDAGHKVTVVTTPYDKSDISASKRVERQTIEGIELIVINFPDSNRYSKLKRIGNFIAFSILSVWYALREPCDIVIASSGPITVGLPVLITKWIRKKPYVFEVRDLWPQGAVSLQMLTNKIMINLAFWFEKICYKNAACVVGCSPGMTNDINRRFPDVKTEVISNASDIKLFAKGNDSLKVSNNTISKFIYAGSIGIMDDVETIVEAANLLKKRGVTDVLIEIVGDGVERKKLEEKALEYRLSNIQFSGLLPKTEVAMKLKTAVATFVCFKPLEVLNTVSPNKMFDSFAAGVPIIQNTTGWIKEYVNEKKCGINVLPLDTESMADAIMKFRNDKIFRDKLAHNAVKAAKEDFNRDILANKYIDIIDGILKQRGKYTND